MNNKTKSKWDYSNVKGRKLVEVKTVKAWARVCVNKKSPCGLIEAFPFKFECAKNGDEICVPCIISYKVEKSKKKVKK